MYLVSVTLGSEAIDWTLWTLSYVSPQLLLMGVNKICEQAKTSLERHLPQS